MPAPLCFVLMPFGRKTLASGLTVDFDAVYAQLIQPAINAAGMTALRADEELAGGVIHKPMIERLLLCDFAVADLTGANANVFYELGLRHAMRPCTTVLVSAETGRLPFDVGLLRCQPYGLASNGQPAEASTDQAKLLNLLNEAQRRSQTPLHDSPVFQLLNGYAAPDISRLKTDVFRDQADYAVAARQRLAQARLGGRAEVTAAAAGLAPLPQQEAGVLVDLLLSYRAVGDVQAMVDLVPAMPEPLARSTLVQEQLGFALNRLGRHDEAEQVLRAVLAQRGPSGETCGLLGRVHKDRWDAATKSGDALAARGWLNKAIASYLQGFEADWRDAYPGINAVTLITLANPQDPRLADLLPVVRYAVRRRLAQSQADYWDHATLLELAVLAQDEPAAQGAAADALANVREAWEPATTARNLGLLRERRAQDGLVLAWADAAEQALFRRSQQH